MQTGNSIMGMTTTRWRLVFLGWITAGLTLLSVHAFPQNTNPPAATNTAGAGNTPGAKPAKKPGAGPFHGKLAALDQAAKTITVGKRTFQITSETRIRKSGKPATLEDAVVGEPVSGYVKPSAGGKLLATTVNFGAKPKAAGKSGPPSANK